MVTVLTVIINTLARQRRDPGAIGAGGGGGGCGGGSGDGGSGNTCGREYR